MSPTYDLAALRERYAPLPYHQAVLALIAVVEAAQFLAGSLDSRIDCPHCFYGMGEPDDYHGDGCLFGALVEALRPFRVTEVDA